MAGLDHAGGGHCLLVNDGDGLLVIVGAAVGISAGIRHKELSLVIDHAFGLITGLGDTAHREVAHVDPVEIAVFGIGGHIEILAGGVGGHPSAGGNGFGAAFDLAVMVAELDQVGAVYGHDDIIVSDDYVISGVTQRGAVHRRKPSVFDRVVIEIITGKGSVVLAHLAFIEDIDIFRYMGRRTGIRIAVFLGTRNG